MSDQVPTATHKVTAQVSHDIRSPLAALNMVTKELDVLPESTRILLRSSINRIQDIANNLIIQNKMKIILKNDVATYLVSPILDEIVSEKRTQFRSKININIELDICGTYGAFAKIGHSDLKRILSNLINNSIEAFCNTTGNIVISLSQNCKNKKIVIVISDDGKGIPCDVLSKLGERGVSFGKEKLTESGSGLGLYHAKSCLDSWGGEFKIESTLGKGTNVILTFPEAEAPDWFIANLNIIPEQKIVIIDDDASIHQVWDRRFNEIKVDNNLDIIHFTNPEEVSNWIKNSNHIENITFLCDYEFIGNEKNGLDLIKENGIAAQSILVTSRYEEEDVRSYCNDLGVKLIPKMMVEVVPFVILKKLQNGKNDIDLVHLDDDDLIRMCWDMSAKKANKKMMSFSNPSELKEKLAEISKATPFYIDSCLGDGIIKGQDLAKELYDQGYENLYMSTGFEKEKFNNMPWLKDVTGKTPPWDNV